jgi:hypothetical protein
LEKNSSLYVAAPYLFAVLSGTVAQTATSPLIDPITGEHVGQVNVDFSSNSVFDALDKKNTVLLKGGFPILIAMEVDRLKETVIGPGFSLGDAPIEIAKLVLSADFGCDNDVCKENLDFFDAVLESMYLGESSTTEVRRSKQGGEIESFIMAYSPINVKSIRPVDSSDFTRGIKVSDHLVYSFALSEMVAEIKAPFLKIKNKLLARANLAMSLLVIVTCLFTLLAIYVSYIVTSSIADRMLYLLDLISSINR